MRSTIRIYELLEKITDSCSLKYDELDLQLRDILNASGIEPKEPAEAAEA